MNAITIKIPFPPSVNRLWNTTKTGRMHRTPKYREWQEEAGWVVREQVRGKSISGEYTIEIIAVKPDKRRRDLGNLEKAISDLLQEVGVIEDDYLCQEIFICWAESGPECSVTIRKYEDG
jgi:Holliday junction resolvase RusA-like endonuclease